MGQPGIRTRLAMHVIHVDDSRFVSELGRLQIQIADNGGMEQLGKILCVHPSYPPASIVRYRLEACSS